MNVSPAPGARAPGRLLGVLRSWLQAWSNEMGPTSDDASTDTGRPKAHSFGSIRVLVVDDNPVNLMLVSALLESRGLVPVLAADGAEAVALACELHFDLVLMDLQMPILDGLKATSAIRQFERTVSRPAVPVVAYSSTTPGAGVLAMHGLNGSLDKPCEDQDLDDCLVRWCPTYRSAPPLRGLAHGNGAWQAASRNAGAGSVALR